MIVELVQRVFLMKNASGIYYAPTWSKNVLITNPSAGGVRSHIDDKVDQFLNEWLKQNPRR